MGCIRAFTDEVMRQDEVLYRTFCDDYDLEEITECPLCKTAVLFDAVCDVEGIHGQHWLILECPNCNEIVAIKWDSKDDTDEVSEIINIFPQNVQERVFEKEIADMSPMFVNTYNQALAADLYGLDEISGMGYRKAMEYLIKDYAIMKRPSEKLAIINKTLSKCIDDYISEPKIKAMAKGAVWLGNDETHYQRRWADKDVNDMKMLIDLTLYWMNFERLTEEYKQTMKLK